MGRRPKSPDAKRAAGDPGKRRRKADASRPTPPAPGVDRAASAPEWLTKDDARRIWADTWTALQRLRFVSDADREPFGRYCQYFAEWLAATRELELAGTTQTVTTTSGGSWIKAHPLVGMRDSLEIRMRDLEDRYGLNPYARFRLAQQLLERPNLATGDLFSQPAEDSPARTEPAVIDPMEFLSGALN